MLNSPERDLVYITERIKQNKNAFLPKTEKGIKTPVLNNKGATSHRSQEYYFIKTGSSSGSGFNARAAPYQDQSQWHLQQAHLYSGGTASAYTDFSIKLTHLFLLNY